MSKFSPIDRIQSFKYAFKGIILLFRKEHNTWIHLSIAFTTIAAAGYLEFSHLEWIVLILTIGFVLAAEAFNTAIEKIADFIQPEKDIRIAHIKDLSAGGVLIAAFSALIVGLLLFMPKFIILFGG